MQQLYSSVRQPQNHQILETADRGSFLEGSRKKPRLEGIVHIADSPDRAREKKSSTGTSIHGLPDEVLQLILQKTLSIAKKDDGGMREGLYRGVCNRWRKGVNGFAKAVCLRAPEGDVEGVLSALQSFIHVTRVRLVENEGWGGSSIGQLLRGMTTGLPSLKFLKFSIRCSGWEALPGLVYFLSHRTSLQELALLFFSHDKEGQPAVGQVLEERARALLEVVDFSNLAHLKVFNLRYDVSMFPEGQGRLPLSKSILGLPRLEAVYLGLSSMSQVHRLPPWLGDLGPRFTLLLVDEAADEGVLCKVHYSESMRSLQRLRIETLHKGLGQSASDTIARLPFLSSLEVVAPRVKIFDDTSEHGIFGPYLKRLYVSCKIVPDVRRPMPLLEDLTLIGPYQGLFQKDLFAFTPRLRSLTLEFYRALDWPDFGRLPRQLTSLAVLTSCARETGFSVLLKFGRLQALQKLHLSCVLLKRVAGVARLPGGTSVTVHCGCHVTTTCSAVYQAECRNFESYAQFAKAEQKCRYLPLGAARQLFLDTRAQLGGGDVLLGHADSRVTRAGSALPHSEDGQEEQRLVPDELAEFAERFFSSVIAARSDSEGVHEESKPEDSSGPVLRLLHECDGSVLHADFCEDVKHVQ
eukprot:jgi/Mesen1/8588/ME000005S08550